MVDCCLCWLMRTRGHDGFNKINKILIKINKILHRPPLDMHGTGGRRNLLESPHAACSTVKRDSKEIWREVV
jgi:hypothetical protein